MIHALVEGNSHTQGTDTNPCNESTSIDGCSMESGRLDDDANDKDDDS